MIIKIISCNGQVYRSGNSGSHDCSETAIKDLLKKIKDINAYIDYESFAFGINFDHKHTELAISKGSRHHSIYIPHSLQGVQLKTYTNVSNLTVFKRNHKSLVTGLLNMKVRKAKGI